MTIEVIHSYYSNGQGGPPQLVVALVLYFFKVKCVDFLMFLLFDIPGVYTLIYRTSAT